MQDDINMYVTRHRLNNASFRQKLDPISKNIFRRQNPLELVFKDILTFIAQNPIIGSLLKEVQLGKKDTKSSLIKKAPNTKDVEIKSRLEELKRFNDGNDNNDNHFPPLTFLPYQPPPPPQPPSFYFLWSFPPPPPTNFRVPSPPRFPPLPNNFTQSENNDQPTIGAAKILCELEAIKGKQEIARENIKSEIDNLMTDILSPPILELSDGLLNVLNDGENIINYDVIKTEDLDEKDIEDIKNEYNFDGTKNTLDEGHIPEILQFFYSGDDNENFRINCEMLGIDGDESEFIDFLWSPKGEEIMQENSLSIHLEPGNIFYNNLNTQESFYDFLLNQQDQNKEVMKKKISFSASFKIY